MTTKDIFNEVVWGNVLCIPNHNGSWPNDYKVENIRHNQETGEMEFNVYFTPVRAIEKIEINFEVLEDRDINILEE